MKKKQLIDLINNFNLIVDLDRWDEKDRNFIRVMSNKYRDSGCVIIYKNDLDDEVGREKEYLQGVFADFWMHIGEVEFKKKLNALISVE